VDRYYFSLNSTMFRAGHREVAVVPFVRAKPLYSNPDTPHALCGQFAALCPGLTGAARRRWQVLFLSRRAVRRVIFLSQRSLTRGLGLRVPVTVLRQTGLLRRERFYLGLAEEALLPAKRDPGVSSIPSVAGFISGSRAELGLNHGEWRKARQLEGTYSLACRLYAQGVPRRPEVRSWVEDLQRGTLKYWRPRDQVWRMWTRWLGKKVWTVRDWRSCSHRGLPACLGCRSCHLLGTPSPTLVEGAPWPKMPKMGPKKERLVLPAQEEGMGERVGIGFRGRRVRLDDWA
jgi:hypothetical protein